MRLVFLIHGLEWDTPRSCEQMIQVIDEYLTEYRVPVYRRLQERLGEDVIVYHGLPRVKTGLRLVGEEEDVGFKHVLVQTQWFLRNRVLVRDWQPAFRDDRIPRVVIVRPSLRDLSLFPALWRFKRRGIPIIGWGHGYSRRRTFQPDVRIRDLGYLVVVRFCDSYVFYTEDIRKEFSSHIAPDRLFVARNTRDTQELASVRRRLEAEGKSAIRRSLDLRCEHYLAFIGRLQQRKEPDKLLEAYFELIKQYDRDVGLLFIGDGPLRPDLERMVAEQGSTDVHFLGPLYGESAARYLFASDVMVMPGALGLAVPHAFALGVPVVSRYKDGFAGHGPEASYIQDAVNGRFVPAEDGMEAFVDAVVDVLDNRVSYSRSAREYAERNLTLDSMVDGLIEAISYATCPSTTMT